MNSPDNGAARQLRFLRIIHIISLAAILIYVSIILKMPVLGSSVTIFNSDDPYLHVIEITFGFITIIALLLGYYLPRLARKTKTVTNPEILAVSNHIVRIAFFEAVAVYGLVLAILGSSWYVWLPFFMLSAIALALTFPTSERWASWMQNRSTS